MLLSVRRTTHRIVDVAVLGQTINATQAYLFILRPPSLCLPYLALALCSCSCYLLDVDFFLDVMSCACTKDGASHEISPNSAQGQLLSGNGLQQLSVISTGETVAKGHAQVPTAQEDQCAQTLPVSTAAPPLQGQLRSNLFLSLF